MRWVVFTVLLLVVAAKARAVTFTLDGTLARQDADEVAITGGTIGPAVAGTSEAYGAGYENDLGFVTKHDLRSKLEASVGTGVGVDALPDATAIGGAAGASILLRPGTGSGETITFGGVNDSGVQSGSRLVARSHSGTPNMYVVGSLDGDDTEAHLGQGNAFSSIRSAAFNFFDDDDGSTRGIVAFGNMFFFNSVGSTLGNLSQLGDATIRCASVRVDNSAYNATTWNGNQTSPTRDDVRDKLESLTLPIGSVTGLGAGVATAAGNAANGTGGFMTVGGNFPSDVLLGQSAVGVSIKTYVPGAYLNSGSGNYIASVGSSSSLHLEIFNGTNFLSLYPDGEGVWQIGQDAAGVTNQAIKGPDRITSDGVGGNVTVAGGRNRGASAGGAVIIQASPAAGAGVTGTLAEVARFDAASGLQLTKTISATTGDQTINKQCGSFIVPVSDDIVTITNSYVTANSVVVCQVASNNAEFLEHEISQTSGSFTIVFSDPPANNTRVNFVVVN